MVECKVLPFGEPDLIRKSFFSYGKTNIMQENKRTSGDTLMKLEGGIFLRDIILMVSG